MSFDQNQKSIALLFARTLAHRDYEAALALCSRDIESHMSAETLRVEFEGIVPLDWGAVDPIELAGDDAFPFVYVVLGGDIYSEAIIINSFVTENGQLRIADFQLGRP